MRAYIFSEKERRLLEEWLETGIESQEARNLHYKIRKNLTLLRQDMNLILSIARKLQEQKRWKGRLSSRSGFGSTLVRAEQGLTRARKELRTSEG